MSTSMSLANFRTTAIRPLEKSHIRSIKIGILNLTSKYNVLPYLFTGIHMSEGKHPQLRPHISFITLGVNDLDRSRRFYAGMGLKEHSRSTDGYAFFDMGGTMFALYPRTLLAKDASTNVGNSEGGILTSLSHNVHHEIEVSQVLQRAEELGGRITRPAEIPPWGGLRGYFADPDGFIWEIAWNPKVSFDPQGHVQLD